MEIEVASKRAQLQVYVDKQWSNLCTKRQKPQENFDQNRIWAYMKERSSFALINDFFFKRCYRTKYSLNVSGHFRTLRNHCENKALRNPLRHSFSLTCFKPLRKAVRVKKRHIFLANLKRILKHSLTV